MPRCCCPLGDIRVNPEGGWTQFQGAAAHDPAVHPLRNRPDRRRTAPEYQMLPRLVSATGLRPEEWLVLERGRHRPSQQAAQRPPILSSGSSLNWPRPTAAVVRSH